MATSRLLNSIQTQPLHGDNYDNPWMDLTRGGQFGYLPRIGTVDKDGKVKSELINHGSYLRRDLIPILLNYPRFFDYLPNTDLLVKTLKALIEDRPIRIEGINHKLSVEYTETPIGAAGEAIVEPTKVKRERNQITFTYNEVMNKSIQRFIEFMIKFGISDPHTNTPLIARYLNIKDNIHIYTPDMYSFTVAFIEPDATNQYAVDGFICTNCWFAEAGERLGSRDITAPKDKLEISAVINPVTTSEPQTVQFCDQLLKNITIFNIDERAHVLPVTREVDPAILASDNEVGFNRGV